jgi:hypothetical protein
MHELSGRLKASAVEGSTTRIVAVGPGGSVLAETQSGDDGAWALPSQPTPEWIVASLSGRRIAAVAARPSHLKDLQFPALMNLQFEFPGAPQGSTLWIDPVEIEGLPPELLLSLRLRANHTIELHLGEVPAAAAQEFQAQRGRYRISGGRISIRPQMGKGMGTFILDRLVDPKTGAIQAARNGEVVISLHESGTFQAFFSAEP